MRAFTQLRQGNWRTILAGGFKIFITLFLLSFYSNTSLAQAGSPATAHRWFAGDGWRQNTADNTQPNMWQPLVFASPNLQPKGIVRCASSAETESGLEAVKGTYHASDFSILASNFNQCFDQLTETRTASVNAPSEGEDIVWFNFDIRPLAGTYQFQIVSNEILGWALYYVDTAYAQPTAAHGATGTIYPPLPLGTPSGNPAHLVYADCGTSGNGWSTITVPSFTLPTNYYLAMWLNDPTATEFPGSMNLTYKSRYGCGGSTCTIQYIGEEMTCAENGYQACEWFGGSAGQWTITDNSQTPASSYTVTYYLGNSDGTVGAMIGSPTTSANPTITLGTIPDGAVFVKICAIYPYGETHSLTLNPVSAYVPPGTSGYVACTSSASTGSHSGPTAPVVDGAPNTQNLNLATTNTANLTASATGGTGTITYAWTQLTTDVNTSFSFNSSTGNATFTVNTLPNPLPAFYEFKVVATDAIGCSSSETVQVVPLASLEPCGIYGDNSVCNGETGLVYTFGDPNTLTPYTLNTTDFAYKWTITGNGTITSAVDNTGTVTVNTNGDGSFVLTMTIDNITGILPDRTCTYTVTVNPLPTCSITGTNVICSGTTTSYSATAGMTTYAWTGPGGFTASTQSTGDISTAGTYTVTITDANGCSSTCSRELTVNPLPTCSITGTNVICSGTTTSYSATAGMTTYAWTGPGGFTASTQSTGNISTAGTYTVTITDANGCSSTCSRELTVNPLPTCEITGNNIICSGGNTSFSATAGMTSYAWTGPGGFTASTQSTGNISTAGTYTVTITDANGCTSTCSRTLTVNQTPTCEITGNNIICEGQTASFTANGGTTFTWVGPNGYTNTGATISGLNVAGTYTVTVTSGENCTSTCSRTLTINPLPTCEITGNNIICSGTTTSFSATAGMTSYAWTGPGGFTASTQSTGNISTAGTYTVTITNANGCSSTCSRVLTVNPLPTCEITGNNIICSGTTTSFSATAGMTSYAWTGPGGFTASTQSTGNISTAGTYTVTITNANGCSSTCSRVLTVNTMGAVEAIATPTTCGLNNGSVTITSPLGANITYSLNGGTPQSETTFSNLAAGTYTIVAQSTEGCTSTGSAIVAPSQPCLTYCSYTQGFWGNKNGLKMLPALLTTPMTLGRAGHSFTIPANSATMLYNAMPGGETPAMLKAGDCVMSTSPSGCFVTQYMTKQGKFNNVLLSQTITLTLNTRLTGNPLLTLPIQSGCLVTGRGTFEMNQNVVDYLTYNGATATVSSLLDLANDLLGGVLIPGTNMGTQAMPRIVPSYSDVTMAIDAINKGFDGCTSFNGYQDCSTLVLTRKAPELAINNQVKISAYPNPYIDQVRFVISSPVSGKGTLDVFNIQGQKVKTVFQGAITANINQVVEYHVADVNRQSLVYIFTMNGERVTGKLLNAKE